MNCELKYGTDHLNWEDVLDLLENRPKDKAKTEKYYTACDKVKEAFENSYLVCSILVENRFVGVCRALSDGVRQSVVYDLNVAPFYRNKGLGESLLRALLKRLPEGPVILFAVPGKEAYYEKFGFHRLVTGMGKFPDVEKRKKSGFIA